MTVVAPGAVGAVSRRPLVHIVAIDDDNWILARLVTILQRELGWSSSSVLSEKADINFFCPYLLIKPGIDIPTKSAALFTHLEETENAGKNGKVARWHNAAAAVDLRVALAQKYVRQLIIHGPAIQLVLPVDMAMFTPRKLRVGVAGRIYKSPSRKGEHLVARLVKEPGIEVVGCGQGWPCPTTFYKWQDVPGFYQSLDLFLITSLVEGGPNTVLEALACGVPVVGPKDVGMLDELPITHYKKGDYDDMMNHIRPYLKGRLLRRRAIIGRTEQAFANTLQQALELL